MNRRMFLRLSLLPILVLLALVTACGGSSSSSSGNTSPRSVKVTLTDSTIQPSITTFTVGTPYTFVVTNKGHSAHDFLIRLKEGGGSGSGPQGQTGILFHSNRPVPPGVTESFSYEFQLSALNSHLQLATQLAGPGGHAITTPIQVTRQSA
jgi:ABC-type transport system substrate-binding protein